MSAGHLSKLRWVRPPVPSGAGAGLAGAPPAGPAAAVHAVGLPVAPAGPDSATPLAEARYLLRAASEIEHGRLAAYLYAAYSCGQGGLVNRVTMIAKEEMGHLPCVQNLLLALGHPPYLDIKLFPTSPGGGNTFPFPKVLEPIGRGSLAKYTIAESPPFDNIADPPLKQHVENDIAPLAGQSAMDQVNHVGALFVALYWLFKPDDTPPTPAGWDQYPTAEVLAVHQQLDRTDWHLKDADFVPQATLETYPGVEDEWQGNPGPDGIIVRPVRYTAPNQPDRAFLLDTLSFIAAQGEGWQLDDGHNSHFERFVKLFDDFATGGGDATSRKVPTNPTTTGGGENAITNPEAVLWAKLFNVRYWMVLQEIALALVTPKDADIGPGMKRYDLIGRVISTEMTQVLRPLARELVRMRRRGLPADGPTDLKAAPPFELPAGSMPDLRVTLAGGRLAAIPDAAAAAVPTLKAVLKANILATRALVTQITGLPADTLDPPLPSRDFLTNTLVPGDDDLLAAVG